MSNPNPGGTAPPPRANLDDLGDTTAGGTPTGTGISGNEVPAIEELPEADDEEEDEIPAPAGIGTVDPVAGR